jgi:hypothetical protein
MLQEENTIRKTNVKPAVTSISYKDELRKFRKWILSIDLSMIEIPVKTKRRRDGMIKKIFACCDAPDMVTL